MQSRRISRILSRTIIHLGGSLLIRSSTLPAVLPNRADPGFRLDGGSGSALPIWACWRWGLPCNDCRQPSGALLPHLFTLACEPGRAGLEPSAVCFLWHYPSGRPGSVLPTTVPCPVRTFLPSRRSRYEIGNHLLRRSSTPAPHRMIIPNIGRIVTGEYDSREKRTVQRFSTRFLIARSFFLFRRDCRGTVHRARLFDRQQWAQHAVPLRKRYTKTETVLVQIALRRPQKFQIGGSLILKHFL